MAVRIMPGEMTESNIIIMEERNENSLLKDKFSDDTLDIIGQDQNSKVEYFSFSQTADYFPRLYVNSDYMPVGNSKPYCLHLDWNRKEKFRQIDLYHSVSGLPNCKDATNPKLLWQPSDPTDGVDFYAFS